MQLGDDSLLDALLEECHVVRTLAEHGPEDGFEQRLRQRGIVGQVRECNFRLDHPELRQMPAGVGIFRAKGGAEGVNLGQRQAIALDVQLSGDGQEGLAPEEILREVDLALGGSRQAHQVQGRNAKQLARTFRVRAVMMGVFTQTKPLSWKKR